MSRKDDPINMIEDIIKIVLITVVGYIVIKALFSIA